MDPRTTKIDVLRASLGHWGMADDALTIALALFGVVVFVVPLLLWMTEERRLRWVSLLSGSIVVLSCFQCGVGRRVDRLSDDIGRIERRVGFEKARATRERIKGLNFKVAEARERAALATERAEKARQRAAHADSRMDSRAYRLFGEARRNPTGGANACGATGRDHPR